MPQLFLKKPGNIMRTILVFLALLIAMPIERAKAEIVFSITPATTAIVLGDSAVFNVFIESVTTETIGGYSIQLNAGPANGGGGRFTSGTFDFLVGAPSQTWDLQRAGEAFSTAFTGSAGGTGVGRTIAANTKVQFGSLTLSTTGATEGTYQMTVSSLSASGVGSTGFLPGGTNGATFTGPVSYRITAVPEPNSLALLGLGSLGIVWLRKRRPKRCV